MKKIAIFLVSSLLLVTIATSAQQVTIRSNNNYDIRIDGRYYNGNSATIPYLSPGYHDLQVYESRGGFFGLGRRRTLVSSTRFYLGNNDVVINVDPYGQARINEYNNLANGNRYDRRWNRRHHRDNDDNYNRNYNNNRY